MHFGRALRRFRRPLAVLSSPLRRASSAPVHSPPPSEFSRVNAAAGVEPIRPELSGLRLRRAAVPRRVTRLLIALAYRWHPSREYRRRQLEMRLMNQRIRHEPRKLDTLPPILSYVEETDIAPTRLQPMLDPPEQDGPLSELPRDLSDIELQGSQRPRILVPRIPGPDPDYLLTYRPLLPRQYRHFLRYSPYPRIAVFLVATVTALTGYLWLSHLHQAEAIAAGRARAARTAFQMQLAAARAYGLDAADLRRLAHQARALTELPQPNSFIPSQARIAFYHEQESAYATLRRRLGTMERHALQYWRSVEAETYVALVEAVGEVNTLGMNRSIPLIPACSTPACYRRAAGAQQGETRWLHQTTATLRLYAAQVAVAADPASAVGVEMQETHNLLALVPRVSLPVQPDRLDALYGTATTSSQYAAVGALAHLDRDALAGALTRSLPARAIVVSIESGTLVCYDHGKAAIRTLVAAGPAVPTGSFALEARQASISALYWNRVGRSARYRFGSIPDWMPFSGGSALQAAPWRLGFGPAGGAVAAYTPDTPGSIDLPPAAAKRVFAWAGVGTKVLVY
jgi:hypothetical protein